MTLKPCPFCGSEAVLFVDGGVRVICTQCRASTMILTDMDSEYGLVTGSVDRVVTAWNRRADDGTQTD